MAKKNKKTTYKTLLSVLANGSTDEARALLIKNFGEDAKNMQDLENKLARMYASSTSKIDIERQFAEIHPHKDFILKYVKPKEELQALKAQATTPVAVVDKIVDSGKMVVAHDGYSNADGDNNCPALCPCMANKYSNATGEGQVANNGGVNQTALVLGLVSVVAIFGMVLYLKQNK